MKRKLMLTAAAALMIALLDSGCAFIPTGLYVAGQFGSDSGIRETNPWPCGNVIYGNTVLIRDAWENEDYLLPPCRTERSAVPSIRLPAPRGESK